ncbi:MAG: hypothetical protein ACI9MC_003660 [Kiritimatiellia bacterium]
MLSLSKRWQVALSLMLLLLAWIPLAPLLTGAWFPFQHDVFLSDLLHVHLPYRTELHERLAAGQLPQWWPDVFSGMPYVAQIETGVFWPPNLVAFFFFDAAPGLNVVWLTHALIAGLSGWFYARTLGARPLVATFAGLAWSLSGGMISHIKHPNFQGAIALMPLMFATLELALAGRARFVWFGFVVAASAWSGMPQVTWLALIGCGVRASVSWLANGWTARVRTARQVVMMGLASGLGLAGAAMTLLPTVYTKAISSRRDGLTWEQGYADFSRDSELLSVLVPYGHHPYAQLHTFAWESWFYLGLSVTFCAVVGVVCTSGRQRVAWLLLALVAVALAVRGPVNWLVWDLLPGMNSFRFHQRFMLLAAIAVLSFAVVGAEKLMDRLPASRWWIPLVLIALTVLDLSVMQQGHLRWERWDAWTQPGPIHDVVPADGENGRLLHIREFRRMHNLSVQGPSDDPATYRHLGAVPLGSLGAVHDLWSAGGYTNLLHYRVSSYFNQRVVMERYQPEQWLDGQPTPAWRSMLDRANVGFVLTDNEVNPTVSSNLLLGGRTRVLRNEGLLPRAYVARSWRAVESNDEAADYMLGPGVSTPSTPTVEGATVDGDGELAPAPVPVISAVPEVVELDLRGAPSGWVVLTDAHYPGWTATLDGVSVPIHFANGYQRAVWIEPGAQRLVFQYWTPGLTAGLLLSAVSLLVMLLWACLPLILRGSREELEAQSV